MSECQKCNSQDSVPYIVHESAMSRMERANKRLWITIIIQAVIICGMFIYESQFETITQEVTQEADNGTNNFAGGDWYGEANNKDN